MVATKQDVKTLGEDRKPSHLSHSTKHLMQHIYLNIHPAMFAKLISSFTHGCHCSEGISRKDFSKSPDEKVFDCGKIIFNRFFKLENCVISYVSIR